MRGMVVTGKCLGRPSVPFCAYAATWIALSFMRHLLQLCACIIANALGKLSKATPPAVRRTRASRGTCMRQSEQQSWTFTVALLETLAGCYNSGIFHPAILHQAETGGLLRRQTI